MTTCCPNCSSPSAVGGELASACAECASVTVAGASFGAPTLILAALGVVALGLAWRSMRHGVATLPRLAPNAA